MSMEMLVASELATSGSVMRKALRILPASRSPSHRRCWSGLPCFISTSMFPVSGAEQLHASGARKDRPMTYDGEGIVGCENYERQLR